MAARERPVLPSGGLLRLGALSRPLAFLAVFILAACSGAGAPRAGGAAATALECVPYAREVSGIQLYGDAASWWDAAAGQYDRSSQPSRGAVLVFRRSGRLPHGHVSVVASLRSRREILVTQANWVHGRIAHGEPVVDVSPGNDWTAVRVWWAPSGVLGTTAYPTFGFIAPEPGRGAPDRPDVVAAR